MATLTELTSYVRSQSLVESDDLDVASVHTIINRGYLELSGARRWPWTLTVASPSTTNGVASLPSDLAFLDHVRYDGDYMIQVSRLRAEQDELQARLSGDPRFFFTEGNTLTLLPVPSGSSSVEVTYHKVPVVLDTGANATPEFAATFHLVLADYALWKVMQREEMYERANVHRNDYLEGVDRMSRYYDEWMNSSQRRTLGQVQGRTLGSNYPFEVA